MSQPQELEDDFIPPEPIHGDIHAPAVSTIASPPTTFWETLRRIGPGLIIAGSIVGSGELIATTSAGASAGFWLLWLILIGCVIKVFAQVEIGRYTIVTGHTAMQGMNEVPGPRVGPANWLLWYWLLMFVFSMAQLGGIVGGVGQSMAMAVPVTGDFNALLAEQAEYDAKASQIEERWRQAHPEAAEAKTKKDFQQVRQQIKQAVTSELGPRMDETTTKTYDDLIWAAVFAVLTSIILTVGRYGLLERIVTALVAGFTVVTIVNLFAMQYLPGQGIAWSDIQQGLMFQLPPNRPESDTIPVVIALMTFGIIGVGATELISYPYWCLEKGYARFTGPRDETEAWAMRARGWLNVLQTDAWCSMIIYTFATIAFYLLGASVLHEAGLNPQGNQMIRTLSLMYQDVFAPYGSFVFLIGAFAVLYSTFFVANGGHARVATDALRVFRVAGKTEEARIWWVKFLSAMFPLTCVVVFYFYPKPVNLVLASGLMQAIMLPMLGIATLYFRYYRCDQRVKPNTLWDVGIWVSVVGLLMAGGSLFVLKILQTLGLI